MTTAHSPLRVLRAQADRCAAALKAAERGETIAADPAGKIAAARARDSITFAVVMDDKVLKITLAWATVRATSQAGLSDYILDRMRETRRTVH